MMSIFKDCKTLDEAKTIFRAAALSAHPDHGGTEENFKALMMDYENYINNFMEQKINDSGDFAKNVNCHAFQDILNKIMHFNINI